ncbi:MAG: hypothetical protein IT532_00205 [Burkholderiales bacterium]|nr:hypothetical protein [Burkholderiales bacterium]
MSRPCWVFNEEQLQRALMRWYERREPGHGAMEASGEIAAIVDFLYSHEAAEAKLLMPTQ